MLGSPLLGTAVGLVLLFATTSLLCSGVTETISSLLQLRARYLLSGLQAMLDAPERDSGTGPPGKWGKGALHGKVTDPVKTRQAAAGVRDVVADRTEPKPERGQLDLTAALFDSPLLASLQSRRVGVLSRRLRNPQYVSGRTFARALVDLLVPAAAGADPPAVVKIAQIRAAVIELPDWVPARRPLLDFLARAGGDIGAFEAAVEQWYDEQMAKIAGWYKRWARVVLGIVGFVVALLLNLDSLQVGYSLYVDAPLQQAVVASADAGTLCGNKTGTDRSDCARLELANLEAVGVPVGHATPCLTLADWHRCFTWSDRAPWNWWAVPLRLLGWVITGFAVSFGAPFWFEALSKLGSLRTAGPPPKTG